ncbi:hypothetical protein BS333_19925 [Vibrio azureus]|uniref:Flagellar hook-length control protein FliK n=1 Tax=Vibrio azureus NBRC 104587 TaxID=1219077 RepID=U3A7U4_9VIBR|nr:flagellar hook-length control protein FliK [Vibrio azureus]AUI88575.1 hypothetical protein BS333_19925 [Vibrio azureus]GAD76031.1 flagellar hook-length control protein FliK [Vibrio azureus NBRC 104587]
MMLTNMIAPNILLRSDVSNSFAVEQIEVNHLSEAAYATQIAGETPKPPPRFQLDFLPSRPAPEPVQHSYGVNPYSGVSREHNVSKDQSGTELSMVRTLPSFTQQDLVKVAKKNEQSAISFHATPTNRIMISDCLQLQPTQPNHDVTASSSTQSSSFNALSLIQSQTANSSSVVESGEWAAIKVNTHSSRWGEQMMQVLQDRVTLQANQNIQEAKIRLDPPDLGKLEVLVRVEGDRLNVQLNANIAATREALAQVSERLRVELQEQHFVHVNVNVGSESGQDSPSSAYHQEEAIVAANHQPTLTDTTPDLKDSDHWLNTHA